MDFNDYLDQLADGSQELRATNLQRLSKLNADQARILDDRWGTIDVRRRRRILGDLIELSEDNVDLDFDLVFLRALRDDDADARLESIRGLWENDSPELLDRLAVILADDPNAAVRAEAALALGRFVLQSELGRLRERHFEKAAAALRGAIENRDEEPEVRARALEAIGAHDEPWVRQAITEAYESDDHRMKVSAVHAMGRSGEPRWLPLLTREMTSDEAELRYEAAVAAGSLGDEDAVPHLVPLLEDDDSQVREAATAALGEIGGQRAKDALMHMLDSSSKATRDAAAAALAEIDFEEDPLGFRFRS
jgi:HEAT repeat protein